MSRRTDHKQVSKDPSALKSRRPAAYCFPQIVPRLFDLLQALCDERVSPGARGEFVARELTLLCRDMRRDRIVDIRLPRILDRLSDLTRLLSNGRGSPGIRLALVARDLASLCQQLRGVRDMEML